MFSTAEDNQTTVEIHVLQGERQMASDNRTIGKFQLQAMGTPALPFHLQGDASQGQKAMVGIEVAGAHRKIGGQDAPAHLQRGVSGAAQLPAGRLQPLHGQPLLSLPYLKVFEGPHVVADQVGAGGPARHPQAKDGGAGAKAKGGPQQMLLGFPEVEVKLKPLDGINLRRRPGRRSGELGPAAGRRGPRTPV